MTEEEKAVLFIIATNFPILLALFVAVRRKWLTIGNPDQSLIDLLLQLLAEAKEDERKKEERIDKLVSSIPELSEVVRQALDFNERLLEQATTGRPHQEVWNGSDRRTRVQSQKPRGQRGQPQGGR